jgi:hypothetical protein
MKKFIVPLCELGMLSRMNGYENASEFARDLSEHFEVNVIRADGTEYVSFFDGARIPNKSEL